MSGAKLRIGYIPLVDAAALLVAVDFGFTAAENLNVDFGAGSVMVERTRQAQYWSV